MKQKRSRAPGWMGGFERQVTKEVVSPPMFRAIKSSPALSGDAEGSGAEVWLTIGFSTRV